MPVTGGTDGELAAVAGLDTAVDGLDAAAAGVDGGAPALGLLDELHALRKNSPHSATAPNA
ncbi:MAG TPA: hypothetical protein VME70_11540 [Mycobacteriales bacterium]|nr:hypothetical protein [Mycobacteriales bacterium]